ncbi:hypothetical protein EPUS_03321 [Endocarpon pusillum Z07020]|uniref:SAGA-associated factor 11 n=1 Tax=Endocarpon pusillum (strain Z07020 / HMAS-L-300199) TaxID=1263415 RepID=U1GGX9_ENDPU|nr:uncharacterized protein EPUS_03321 [Endocarpon pusillum Z07020]ERF71041.1 hypothetical protein EPUS_03321 [Endocarpon pusillum Z07020]
MSPKAPKVEPLSPDHWDKFAPPIDQDLWKRYMNEDDSNSDESDTEQEDTMAGPSADPRGVKGDAQEVKPVSKAEMIKEVLDDSFNEMIYNILDGSSTGEAAKEANPAPEKAGTSEVSDKTTTKDTTSTSSEAKPSKTSNDNESSSTKPSKSESALQICSNCNLPRLKYPRIGLTSRPLPDPNASYCANEPPVVLAGHDVHGNAFPGFKPKPNAAAAASSTSKTTKPKPNGSKSDKKAAAATADASSPSGSQDSSTPSTSFEYPQIRTPQMKCPNNCGQWKAVNVMAKHLDACLLGKGRRAGREARERIGAGTGTGNGTPVEGSRAGTPKPGTAGAGAGSGNGGVKRKGVDEEGAKAGGKKQKKGK